jgi:hypothetical protein
MKGELPMGVKYGREYSDIIKELVKALENIEGLNDFFSMNSEEWQALAAEEKQDCIHTLADDVIYALGQDPSATVGSGYVEYDDRHHILKVFDGSKITIVSLI